MAKFTAAQIKATLATLPGWSKRNGTLRRTFEFVDFAGAMKFVNGVARAAERVQHHPDIDIRWNKVTLVLVTHDEGGITEKDFALAAKCNLLA